MKRLNLNDVGTTVTDSDDTTFFSEEFFATPIIMGIRKPNGSMMFLTGSKTPDFYPPPWKIDKQCRAIQVFMEG